MGGMIPAIEHGFPQAEIANASYAYQREVEHGDQIIVGVNAFAAERERPLDLLQMDEGPAQEQALKLAALRATRNSSAVSDSLDQLRSTAASGTNTMPYILKAVRAYATLGEICDALRDVFGTYQESSIV